MLSGPEHGDGPELIQPNDIGVAPGEHGRPLFVVDTWSRALVRVDVETGDRTWVSAPGIGAGVPLSLPLKLAVPGDEPRAIVADIDESTFQLRLIEIDLTSGDRALTASHRACRAAR